MSKTKLVLVACFLAALAAGLAAGVALRCAFGPPPRLPTLEEQLKLSAQQREQMRQIWSGVMRGPWQERGRHEELLKERDAAVAALLTTEEKAKYEELMKSYSEKMAALESVRRKAVDEAVESTKRILTEPQRKKYEELLSKHRPGPRGPHGRLGEPGGPGGPGGEPMPPSGGPVPGGPRP